MTAPDPTTVVDHGFSSSGFNPQVSTDADESVLDERRRVTRHGLVYIFGAVAQGGLGFLLLPFLTRIIGLTQFGVVSAALALAAVLTALLPLGLNNAIVRLFYDEPAYVRHAEWSALLIVQFVISLVLVAVLLLSGPLWGGLFRGVGWSAPLALAVVYSFALGIQETTAGVLRAARRPGAFVGVILTQTILGGGLALWLASRSGASGYMTGLCIGAGISAVMALMLAARRPRWRTEAVLAGLAVGFPFLFHSLSNWVLNLSDRLVIEADLGLNQLAQYQLAYVIATVAFILFEGMQSAWAPFYFSLPATRKRSLPALLFGPATAVAAGFGCLLVAVAPVIVVIAAPASFGRNYVVIALVAATVCVRPAYLLGIVTLLDSKRGSRIAVASVSAAAINLGLNLLLVPLWGVDAAAGATLVAYGLQALIVDRSVYRNRQIGFGLVPMLASWGIATAVILSIALLPTNAAGWAARGGSIVVAGVFTVRAIQRLRLRFAQSAPTSTLAQ